MQAFDRGELSISGDGLSEAKVIGSPGNAAVNFFFPYANTKAVDVLRMAAGSGVLAMSEADYAHPDVAPLMDEWLIGPGVDAEKRLALMKLAWDMTGTEFGSRAGLGRLISQSADAFNMPELFAGVIVLAVAGIAMTAGFGWLEKRLVPWTKD